jgi:hypothetical protein
MSFCQCLIMDHMHVFGMFIVLCWSCFSWEAGLQCIIKSRWSCLCSCKAVSSFLGMCKTLVMPQCWLLETGYCLFIVLSVWPVPWQLLYWLKFSVVLSGGACSPPPPLLYLDSKYLDFLHSNFIVNACYCFICLLGLEDVRWTVKLAVVRASWSGHPRKLKKKIFSVWAWELN